MAVGLVVVGLGNVGSSLLAGIEAARAHLVHPWGSLADAGGSARTPEYGGAEPLRARVPLAELTELELGAFELRDDNAYQAAMRAGLLDRSLLDELRPRLRQLRAMAGARQAPTRRHLADALCEDLRGFLEHGGCQRGIVVCTAPGLRDVPGKPPLTARELWSALEKSDVDVTPGLVYAAAAAQAGCAFVCAAHDAALQAPGLAALFAEAGLPVAGVGLLTPDVALREAVAQLLGAEALGLVGTTSLSTRVEERGARLWGGPDRTQEMGLASAWAGGAFELSIELRGQIALHLAARALDAALFVDLAARAGRSGAQDWMDALFAAPILPDAPREAQPATLAERRARMHAELPLLAATARTGTAAA
ncbi:MAG TPA: inositol-3-phosphate synthase [Myxococcales bacterium]|nr:inositol-3-phosphate synthase [Myxococcales bacterium]